jgi:hypothetical protein
MSLSFKDSNFLVDTNSLGAVQQYVFYYSPQVQRLTLNYAEKIVVHCWGGGGGGGASFNGTGSGGGGSFTILDFPYFPFEDEIYLEVEVGKGGSGGYYSSSSSSNYIPAQNGGNTIVKFKNISGRVLKEFISYGGKGGAGNMPLNGGSGIILPGGDPGGNSLVNNLSNPLMDAYFFKNGTSQIPRGGTGSFMTGDHCQINYMNVTGGGGGTNMAKNVRNDGGSFILNRGGNGGTPFTSSVSYPVSGGGGGSTYYGKGGDGLTSNSNPNGTNADPDSGAGGGGAGMLNTNNNFTIRGGNGGNGLVIIEYYN